MSPVCRCGFLLLLLVCDWVGDPHLGRSPLSRRLASQEVVCHTVSLGAADDWHASRLQPPGPGPCLAPEGAPCPLVAPAPAAPGPAASPDRLVYVLRSIRC
jgi:hypothetical protein